MQSVWKIILSDEDFVHAYLYGMVIKCVDGIERRIYPRVFTYSADYPEKYILLYLLVGSFSQYFIFAGFFLQP